MLQNLTPFAGVYHNDKAFVYDDFVSSRVEAITIVTDSGEKKNSYLGI